MDIIDIAIARAKSFTGETAKLVKEAQQAMADANKIIDDVSAIESEATSASEVAQEAAAAAQAAAAEFDEMKADIEAAVARQLQPINSAVSSLDDRIDTIETTYSKVDLQNVSGTGYSGFSISNIINGTTETNTVKLYNAAGAQTDGAMTQKAVSDITSSLDSRVTVLESGGAHFDPAYASLLVSINSDGGLAPFNVSKSDVIQLMLKNEMFMSDDIFGIVIDYTNKTTLRMRGSADISTSQHAKLFKERVRCIVDSDGKILKFNPTAADLTSTYENKDVMVYQPAFYYLRIPYDIMYTNDGAYVTKELLAVTDNPNYGFKRHPAFYDINGKEVSYALFGAFEASVYDTSTNTYVELDDPSGGYNSAEDTLMSIYNKKPASGMHGS